MAICLHYIHLYLYAYMYISDPKIMLSGHTVGFPTKAKKKTRNHTVFTNYLILYGKYQPTQTREIRGNTNLKRGGKYHLAYDKSVYVENPPESIEKLLQKELNKIARYKINIKKSLAFI